MYKDKTSLEIKYLWDWYKKEKKTNKGGFLWISFVLQCLFLQAKKFTYRYNSVQAG